MATLRKTLLIGLDGGTFDVVDPLLRRGELPHLAGLIERGVRGELRSTIPPITAPAWPSLLTGLSPGRHGIYSFHMLDHVGIATGHLALATSDAFAGRTLFDYVGRAGGRVLGVDVPMCYPPWPVQGRLLAGFPTPNPDRPVTHPPEWADDLAPRLAAPRREQLLQRLRRRGPRRELAGLEAQTARLTDCTAELIRSEGYDFTMQVTTAPDRVQHYYWGRRHRGVAPDDPVDEAYRLADRMIGRLLAAAGEDWLVGVVSDHGAGDPPEFEFPVHAWLAQRGWLAERQTGRASRVRRTVRLLRRGVPRPLRPLAWRMLPSRLRSGVQTLDTLSRLPDWSATRAYFVGLGYPFGAISINLRGREPFGIVEPGQEYERLCAQILAELSRAVDPASGAPLVAGVWRREELYSGPCVPAAPDLIFETSPRYRSRGGAGVEWDTPMELAHGRITGDHRAQGMLVLAGESVFRPGAAIQGARIVDVAPTLLYAMGAPVPEGLDGRVREEAFEPRFLGEHPPRFGEALASAERPATEYSRAEEEQVREALRRLGYIE